MTQKRHLLYLATVISLLTSFFAQPVQVYSRPERRVSTDSEQGKRLAQVAQTSSHNASDYSADLDGDGLSNDTETNGWCDAAGCFKTDPMNADSDHDGLTDGEEKLFDTNPLDGHSPGIFVKYQEQYMTKKYSAWQRYGNKYIALSTSGQHAAVIRRGTTLTVGGPVSAALEINKSIPSLTTLTAVPNPCAGGWQISVPANGTVGIYTLTASDGNWSQSLILDVIFELPAGKTDAFLDTFVYDDNLDSFRDATAILYAETDGASGQPEYGPADYGWIPQGEWIAHGHAWRFDTEQYYGFVFQDNVMPAINGKTNTWDAGNALAEHVDDVTCFGNPRPLSNSWCVLNPSECSPYNNKNECSNISGLLTAFNRSAGIPARPVFADEIHSSFDHSTEIWTTPSSGSKNWYVTRGYKEGEYNDPASNHCASPAFSGGYNPLQSTSGWYSGKDMQGVYAAAENWNPTEIGGDTTWWDGFRLASWDLDRNAETGKIVKRSWWETRFRAYWNWLAEPQVTGTPPDAWPQLPPAPTAVFTGTPVLGSMPLTVTFTDGSIGQVRSRLWSFGDGITGTDQSPSHTYASIGDFTVTLAITGAGGSDTATKVNYIQVGALPSLASSTSSPESATNPSAPAIRFDRVVADAGVDLNGDGRYDQLVFKIQVDVATAGHYWFRGRMAGNLAEAVGDTYLDQGPHTVELPFSGQDLFMGKADGPYTLQGLWATDVQNPTPVDLAERSLAYLAPAYKTQAYRFGEFGLSGATLAGTISHRAIDTDGDGHADTLVVETGLNIAKPGTYTVQGVLSAGPKETPIVATWIGSDSKVTLQFSGLRGTVGPYTLLGLHVRNEAQQVTDGIKEPVVFDQVPELSAKPVLLGDKAITSSTRAPLGPNFAITNTAYSDSGVDTNGDGLYDQLVITAAVVVTPTEASQAYRLEGWLADSNGTLVAWAISEPRVLTVGVQSLSLAFDGRMINEHGVDGPFTLIALKALSSQLLVLDEVDVAFTTFAYDHTRFKASAIPPAVNIFADRMENGANQWTAATPPWSLGNNVWFSYSHAWQASGSRSGSLSRTLNLSNYVQPALRFKTCYAMQSANDRGYVEASSDGVNWTRVSTFTNSTTNWATTLLDLSQWGRTSNLRLRFNANSQAGLRWYVDDVSLDGWPAVSSASFSASPRPAPVGADVTFAASYTSINTTLPVTYTWNLGDGSAPIVSKSPTMVHRFLSTGTYMVQLAVENPYDRRVVSQMMTVYRLLNSTFFSFAPVFPAEKAPVTFAASFLPTDATQPVTYTWSFGDGSAQVVSTSAAVPHTFADSGNYTVILTTTNGYGAPVINRRTIFVGRPVATISYTFNPTKPLNDDQVTFTATFTPASATQPVTYTWDFGDASSLVTTTPSAKHTFGSPGKVTVWITATNGYSLPVVYSSTVTVGGRPLNSVTLGVAPRMPAVGTPVTFNAITTPLNAAQPVTYTWDFGDNSAPVVTRAPTVVHIFDMQGTYTSRVTATNGYGLPVVSALAVTVVHRVFLPLVFR